MTSVPLEAAKSPLDVGSKSDFSQRFCKHTDREILLEIYVELRMLRDDINSFMLEQKNVRQMEKDLAASHDTLADAVQKASK